MAVKCILTGQEKVSLSGDTMTGDLKVGSSRIGTNGYVEGTWLRTTKATESAGNFATISGDGWIYKRAPANVLGDIGGQAKITANGILKGDGNGGVTSAIAGKDYDTEIVYVNYTGDTPTKDNITNINQVLEAYKDGKMIAIQYAPKTFHTTYVQKSPFILSYARKYGMPDRQNYIFDFVSEYIEVDVTKGKATSCPYCITIDFSEVVSEGSSLPVGTIVINGVTDRGLAKPMPSAHAYTHKTGGDDPIVPSDIGAQSKITANGILKGDGTGTITSADETEVELVDLPQEVFWATYGKTTNAELEEAYNANKLIMLWHDNKVYYLASKMSNFLYQFFAFVPNSYWRAFYIICYNNTWTNTAMTGTLFDRSSSLSLPTASWTGSDPYTQTVTLSDSVADTKVDIQPSEEVYDQLVADNVGYFAIKNVDGTLTAVAKGGKPSVDLTVQVTYNSVH